jgi:RHS repeat-associated protein
MQQGPQDSSGVPQTIEWQGTDCGDTLTMSLQTSGFFPYTTGPAALRVGSVLATAPVLPPDSPGIFDHIGGGNPSDPNWVNCNAGDPVDCATGNFYETQTDLSIRGHGLPFGLARTYNTIRAVDETAPGPFGYGWSSTFGDQLQVDSAAGTAVVIQANGSQTPFTISGSTITPAHAWTQASLSQNTDGSYTYTLPDQSSEQFSSNGQLASESDRYGNTLSMAYDGGGHLQSISDQAGRTITLTWGGNCGCVTGAQGPMGTVSYGYDTAENLTTVTDLDAGTWTFAYDGQHRMTSLTNPLGHTTSNTYDDSNRVVSQTDGANRTTTWSYQNASDGTPFNAETVITSPKGNVTDEQFNDAGLPLSVTHGEASPAQSTRTFVYDASLNPAREIDGDGHLWSYNYDKSGNRVYERDPLGHITTWTYDDTHDVTSVTDPLDHTTYYQYQNGELAQVSRQLAETWQNQTTSYGYNSRGDLTSVTDPRNNTWTYAYDSAGNRTSMTAPDGQQTTWGYDQSGYLTSVVTPAGNAPGADPSQHTTTYTNDPYGRPTLVTDPLGHHTATVYDKDGNKVSWTDAANHTTTYDYNGDNEQTTIAKPDGTTLTTSFDVDGNTASQTDGAGHTTTYEYNALDERSSATDALNRATNYSYDHAGNLTATTDPEGRTTTYGYDVANNLTNIDYADGNTPHVSYAYNAAGDRTSMIDGTGTSSYSYDSLGRLTNATNGAGDTTAYGYDLANNVTSLTYPGGHQVARAYDAENRLTSVTDWLGNLISFAYDPNSNLTQTTFPSSTGDVDTYAYDQANELTGIAVHQWSTTLASINYTRDPLGRVSSATEAGLAQPQNLGSQFQYDRAGNLGIGTLDGYTYNAASELTVSPTTTYAYNELGERTGSTPNSGNDTSYGYDQAGRLTGYTPATGDPTAFAYDGDGLRASKTTASATTTFTWDQTTAIPLVLGDGTNSYIYGPDNLPVEQVDNGSQAPAYLHHDQLGSTRLITNQDGETAGTLTYGPYGAVAATTGWATTPLQYAGQYSDSETGLQYEQARYYDPATGQFITRDPLAELTHQPYGYAASDPIDGMDPTGLDPAIAAGCAIGEAVEPAGGCVPGAVIGAAGTAVASGIATIISLFGNESSSGASDDQTDTQANANETTDCNALFNNPVAAEGSGFTRLSEAEQATLGRLQALSSSKGLTFTESAHVGAEVVDNSGRSYDFLGDPAASAYFSERRFTQSIANHLRKSNDFTVVDLTGFTEAQQGAVSSYLDSLPASEQARLIRIGF